MKILFVRPPRYMWPFNSESSSFWQPLGFASMAAVLRENDFYVEIIDCLPLKIGWSTLRRKIESKNFDVLCVGDETASANESIKLTKFVKEIKPKATTIGGGYFFPYMENYSLNKWNIDYLVRGEGEQTLLELISWLDSRKRISKDYLFSKKNIGINSIDSIKGVIHKKNREVRINKEREPIDINKLPIPAYDLLPMELYGKNSTNHRDFAAIEHGRGCTGNCDFCSINALYSFKGKSCYRTKSAEKSFEETKVLVEKYRRKTLNWADGTFNLDAKWDSEYFQLLEDNDVNVLHTAWMRADCIVRDEEKGIMKKMVDNGLVQAVVGLERLDDNDHEYLHTTRKEYETCKKAFAILKKYKKVYTIATHIYGLPHDSKKELKQIRKFIYKGIVDFRFILPFTPYPGTKLWEKYKNKFQIDDFQSWNLHRPVMGTAYLSRDQLDNWFKWCLFFRLIHINFYNKIFFERDKRKRQIHVSLAMKLIKALGRGVIDSLRGQKVLEYGKRPEWYDS